jgi:hypothetical protein
MLKQYEDTLDQVRFVLFSSLLYHHSFPFPPPVAYTSPKPHRHTHTHANTHSIHYHFIPNPPAIHSHPQSTLLSIIITTSSTQSTKLIPIKTKPN